MTSVQTHHQNIRTMLAQLVSRAGGGKEKQDWANNLAAFLDPDSSELFTRHRDLFNRHRGLLEQLLIGEVARELKAYGAAKSNSSARTPNDDRTDHLRAVTVGNVFYTILGKIGDIETLSASQLARIVKYSLIIGSRSANYDLDWETMIGRGTKSSLTAIFILSRTLPDITKKIAAGPKQTAIALFTDAKVFFTKHGIPDDVAKACAESVLSQFKTLRIRTTTPTYEQLCAEDWITSNSFGKQVSRLFGITEVPRHEHHMQWHLSANSHYAGDVYLPPGYKTADRLIRHAKATQPTAWAQAAGWLGYSTPDVEPYTQKITTIPMQHTILIASNDYELNTSTAKLAARTQQPVTALTVNKHTQVIPLACALKTAYPGRKLYIKCGDGDSPLPVDTHNQLELWIHRQYQDADSSRGDKPPQFKVAGLGFVATLLGCCDSEERNASTLAKLSLAIQALRGTSSAPSVCDVLAAHPIIWELVSLRAHAPEVVRQFIDAQLAPA